MVADNQQLIEGCDGVYIDGDWTDSTEHNKIEVHNPATDERIATVLAGTKDNVETAFSVATEAQHEWKTTPLHERAEIIKRAIQELERLRDNLVSQLAIESGSATTKGEVELDTAINHFEAAVDPARTKRGKIGESRMFPGKEDRIQRRPVGVVGVITPWNFPLALAARAVAPALALGNAVVLKPSEETPFAGGLILAQVFENAGLPAGLFNVVPGYGDEAGEAVAANPAASVVSFTGSTTVGKHVAKLAAERLAEPTLELGGNNPYIVLDDANPSAAIDGGVFGTFMHQGQVCISINRHLVHESIYEEYINTLTERAKELPVGDPLKSDTIIGPVINEHQRDKLVDVINSTIKEGATLMTGGDCDGLFIEPTVLRDVTNEMSVACDEHSGPIAPVIPFETEADAIALANDTDYGLSAAVHSTDIARAERVSRELDCGMVHINDQPLNGDPYVPFGGTKDSGIGRFNGDAIYHKYTESKWTSIQREPQEYPF